MVHSRIVRSGPEIGSAIGIASRTAYSATIVHSSCGGQSRGGNVEQAEAKTAAASSIVAMTGGLAVRRNLLCVTWSSARGHVFLFDLQARVPTSSWTLPVAATGYSDAAGVAMDDRFHIYVADPQNHCVRHFSAFGRHLGDIGHGPLEDGEVARDRPGTLWRPNAVAISGDDLWVACGELPLRRAVQRFSRDGKGLAHLRSCGDPELEFGAPRGIWVDAEGILVADTLLGRIQRFRPDGRYIASIACGGPTRRARPLSVVRARDGRVLVLDGGDQPTVRAFASDGQPLSAGELAARTEHGTALAVDEAGRIYVLDRHGERVQRFHADLTFDSVLVDLAEHLDGFPNPTP